MRKLFLVALLIFLPTFCHAEDKVYFQQKFGGEDTKVTPKLLNPEESPGMSNFTLDETGAIKERDLFGQYNSSSGVLGSNSITGLFKFYTTTSKYFLACAGTKIASGAGGTFSTDLSPSTNTVTANSFWSAVTFNNNLYLFNPSVPMMRYTGSGGVNTIGSYPSTNCSYSAIHKNRVWAARSDTYPYRMYYSTLANGDDWVTTGGFIDLPDYSQEITGIYSWGGSLYIFTETNIYILTGSTPNSFALVKSNSDVGSIAPRSIQVTDKGIFFLSRTGVFAFNGTTSYKLSDKVESIINSISKVYIKNACAIFDGQSRYWLSYPDSSSSYNNKCIIYDTTLKEWYPFDGSRLAYSYFCKASGGSDRGEIYGGSALSDGIVWQLQTASGTESITHETQSALVNGVSSDTVVNSTPYAELESVKDSVLDSANKLLLHFDGVDGAVAYTSNDSGARIVSFFDNAQLDTEYYNPGNSYYAVDSSLKLDGSGDYVSVPDSGDWTLGTNDFQIDFKVMFNVLPTGTNHTILCSWRDGVSQGWYVAINKSGSSYVLTLHYSTTGADSNILTTSTFSMSTNSWYHFSLARKSNVLYIYKDGVNIYSGALASSIADSIADLLIGALDIGGGARQDYSNVWLDEIRIANGSAYNFTSFTAPTVNYPYGKSYGTLTSQNLQINASSGAALGTITWSMENPTTGTSVAFQTRTGATSDSVFFNGWQYWSSANTVTLSTVTDATAIFTSSTNDGTFTVKKPYPALRRDVLYYEDEDSVSVNCVSINTAGAVSKGKYIEGWISPSDISSYDWLGGWYKTNASGNTIEFYFGEGRSSNNYITFNTVTNSSVDGWNKWYWYIGGIPTAQRDRVTYIKYRYMGDSVGFVAFGEVNAYNFYDSGDTMSSTQNDYIQYRAIFGSNDMYQTPALSSVTLVYTPSASTEETSLTSYYYTKPIDFGVPMKNKVFDSLFLESKFDTTSSTVTVDYTIDDGAKTGTLTFPYTCVTDRTVRMKKNFPSATYGKTMQYKFSNSDKDSQLTLRSAETRYKEESLND